MADGSNQRIRRLAAPLPGFTHAAFGVASSDGNDFYSFDASGRILTVKSLPTASVRLAYGYDGSGRLVTVTDADGNVTTIQRDSSGAPTAIVGPYGATTSLTIGNDGLLVSASDPTGSTYQMAYTAGMLTAFTYPRGSTSTKSYDALGRLTADVDTAGASLALLRTADSATDVQVFKTSATDLVTQYHIAFAPSGASTWTNMFPNGTIGVAQFGADGSRTSTAPDGTRSTHQPTADPRFGMQVPVAGTVTTKTPSGLTKTSTSSRWVTLASSSDPFSLVTSTDTTKVNGSTWTTMFNAATRTRTSTSPAGRKTYVSLDVKGRIAGSQLDSLLATTFGYDTRGRLASVTQGTRAQSFGYDAQGYLGSATDALSETTLFERDAAGRVTRETLPDSSIVPFGYDAEGNLTSLAPPGRPAHEFAYDPRGLLTRYTPPVVNGSGLTSTSYAYDPDRHLTDVVRPDGGDVHLDYDTAGLASTVTLPTGETISLGYSPTTSKLTSASGPSAGQSFAYGYDGFLLTDTTWSGLVSGNVHRTYDNFFRLATETVNGASPVTYGYDADGLVTSVGAMTLVPSPVNGLLTGTTLGGVTDSYTYDAYGQVKTYTAKFGATVLYAYSIDERDALGRITGKTETIQGMTHAYQYGYRSRGWLTDVSTDGQVTGHYEYDANGNRTLVQQNGVTQTAYFDDQARLLAQGTLQFTYTANGEVRTKTDTVTGEVTTYAYDALGNLVRVELPDGRVIEYVIDAMGRRVGKKVNGTLVKGWLYRDGLRIVAETDGSGNVVSRFVYADGVGAEEPVVANLLTRLGLPRPDILKPVSSSRLVYMLRGSSVYRVLGNHLSSLMLAIDPTNGPPSFEAITYDEWGKVLLDSSPGVFPIGFSGGLYDADTGLVRLGARDYSADAGRWTARDPAEIAERLSNQYVYVLNDPVNVTDTGGLYGTTDCSYYAAKCEATLSSWYCGLASWVCNKAGENWASDCIRECLQDCNKGVQQVFDEDAQMCGAPLGGLNTFFGPLVECHAGCIPACLIGGGNPF